MGPNAGDVTQGFTLAFIKGCTKADLDSITAIHPTNAEVHMCNIRKIERL